MKKAELCFVRSCFSRFPTKENIEKVKAQKQEMFDRGERIPKQGKPFQSM